MNTPLDKLFRDRDALISGRPGRWLVVICSLALGAFLVFAQTSLRSRKGR
jgi:hypothetical protein